MLKNFMITAFRNFIRHKGYVIINILGLGIGIAVFSLIVSYVQYEFNADKFHQNYSNIYRIDLNSQYGVTPITMKQTVADRFPDIVFTRYFPRTAKVIYEEAKLESRVLFVDPEFFDIFDYEVIRGNLQEALTDPFCAIITDSWAEKMFGDDDPIGKTINYNREVDLEIKVIIKNPEYRSQLLVREVIAPIQSLKGIIDFENAWFSNFVTFLMVTDQQKSSGSIEQINAFFVELRDQIDPDYPIYYTVPFSETYFDNSKFDYCAHGNRSTVVTFLAAAIFIIFIACFNYINLSVARAALRAKEIGIRKVSGSSRALLIWQMLGESLLQSLLALLLIILIIWFFYPVFSDFFRLNAVFFTFSRTLLLIGFTLTIGLIAGIYPAFYQTGFLPVNVLKGENAGTRKGVFFRKLLIILQFTISIAMIICALTVNSQLHFFIDHELGFDKEQVVTFRQTVEIMESRDAFRQELLKSAYVKDASYIYLSLGNIIISSWYIEEDDSGKHKKRYKVLNTDPHFIDVYNVKLTAGRNFDPDLESDHDNILVNETFVKEYISGNPLEYTIWENTHVIGVVSDFAFRPLHHEIEPIMLFWSPDETFAMALRVDPANIERTMSYVEEVFHKYAPDVEFEYSFQDDTFSEHYYKEKRFGKIFTFFAGLAVFIACLGMFGLASFLITRRTREIGIRKVLGAKSGNIVILLNREFTHLVLIAGLIATPLAWYVMHNWLENFAYRINLSAANFIIATMGALIITWITVSWQTWKAARTNPVDVIKYE